MSTIHPAPSGKIPILLYHDLQSAEQPNEKQGAATQGTVVSANNFEQQIKYLHDNGYKTISLDQYLSIRRQDLSLPRKTIILTFDDGHISNYTLAFPILKQYGYTACFFVVTKNINTKFHLSRKQIIEMHRSGMEFGSHGTSHAFLPLLSRSELIDELQESKQILENILKTEIYYLAYPGGHYNNHVLGAARSAGYYAACSCVQGFNGFATDLFRLRRIEIRSGFDADDFSTLFNPFSIAFYQFVDTTKACFKRLVGLRAYAGFRKKLYKFYFFKR